MPITEKFDHPPTPWKREFKDSFVRDAAGKLVLKAPDIYCPEGMDFLFHAVNEHDEMHEKIERLAWALKEAHILLLQTDIYAEKPHFKYKFVKMLGEFAEEAESYYQSLWEEETDDSES